jgi:hypothetical protein
MPRSLSAKPFSPTTKIAPAHAEDPVRRCDWRGNSISQQQKRGAKNKGIAPGYQPNLHGGKGAKTTVES